MRTLNERKLNRLQAKANPTSEQSRELQVYLRIQDSIANLNTGLTVMLMHILNRSTIGRTSTEKGERLRYVSRSMAQEVIRLGNLLTKMAFDEDASAKDMKFSRAATSRFHLSTLSEERPGQIKKSVKK